MSPYLLRNPPVDILDLWPGAGFLSTRVNDLLQPRRHLLLEPRTEYSDRFLKSLPQSKPCYKIINGNIYERDDWPSFLATHFPEQGLHNRQTSGLLPKNDTLLVLANLPTTNSSLTHFTPGRWWLKLLTSCLEQNGLNVYGSIRVLATSPSADIVSVLPRSAADRTRTGLLTEMLGLHTLEIANRAEHQPSHSWRGWKVLENSRKRVAERTAALGIVTPPGREFPLLEAVPAVPGRGRKESPYQPRPYLELHKDLFAAIEKGDALGLDSPRDTKDPKAKAILKKRSLAITKLARDNSAAYQSQKLADMRLEIDEMTESLSRAATDPKETPESLKALGDEIASLESAFAKELSSIHWVQTRQHEKTVDDARLALISKNFDDSILVSDRRPFEPLYIDSEEIYPRGIPRGVLYLEMDSNPAVLKRILELPNAQKPDAIDRLMILMSIVGTRGSLSVAEFLERMFPHRSINDLVQAIPMLARFAQKRVKSGCGPVPLPDGVTSDPVSSYQANMDYDLREVRIRILCTATLVDLLMEYEKAPDKPTPAHFSRTLGGTLTMFQVGEEAIAMRIR